MNIKTIFAPILFSVLALSFAGRTHAQRIPDSNTPSLKSQLRTITAVYEGHLSNAEERVVRTVEEVSQANRNLVKRNVNSESYEDVMRLLHTQRIQLIIDLAGIKAKEKELAKAVSSHIENDSKTKILNSMLAKLEENRERVAKMHDNGSVSKKDLQDVEMKILSTRLQLTEAQRPISESSVSGSKGLLKQVAVERVEKQAKLEAIDQLLADYYSARQEIEQVRQLDRTLISNTKRVIDLKTKLEDLQMELETNVRLED